jgi:hypothetical protein
MEIPSADFKGVPHLLQKIVSSGLSVWHLGHLIAIAFPYDERRKTISISESRVNEMKGNEFPL